jgi:hypothetical protein
MAALRDHAVTPPDVGRPPRRETAAERADRNLGELMGELRVALPGVQVLFGFLLVVPFNQGFHRISAFERRLYFVTLLATALASMLLIAPSIHHRLAFQRSKKPQLVARANKLMIVGLVVLSAAMTCAVLLVTHVLFGGVTSIITACCVGGGFAGIWYGLAVR